MTNKNNFYIITGGPGSGKTTLIDQLRKKGYNCIAETGRKIIKEELELGGTAIPWLDSSKYAERMLQHSIQDYLSLVRETNTCFFDRGIPDVLGYIELCGLSDKNLFINAVEKFRYNPTVFILPPWKEIYETDSERKQNFELAVATYLAMKKVYVEYKYQIIEIPCMSLPKRVELIVDLINYRLKS